VTHDDNDTADAPAESPHRVDATTWGSLVTELKADKPAKKRASRGARAKGAAQPSSEYAQTGLRSAWEIALERAGRLGRDLGDGKRALLCINDGQHTHPDCHVELAGGSCVLLPPAGDSIFGLPQCSHAHCQHLSLRRWIAAVGYDVWAQAMVEARGWRVSRDFLLHDTGISGWKRTPFSLRDGDDTVESGPYQILPDDADEYCDFPARIIADVEEHDVGSSRRWYEIEATVSGRVRRFRVSAAEFGSLSWVSSQLGPEAVISPGRDTAQRLRAAIQYLSKPVPRRDTYTYTGWRKIGEQWVYLHAGGGLGAEGHVLDLSVALQGEVLPRFRLPVPPPTGEALHQAVQACVELFDVYAADVTIPLFGAVWRAPLGASQLTVYLSAPPRTGKSMLAALAQQHFGPAFHENALPASVKHSTAASVNALRSLVGDALFTLDDFMVSGNAAEDLKLGDKIDSVVRAQYGGTGAQRLARDGTLAATGAGAPRSTLLITGETLPRGHSLRTRMLVLELPGPIARDLDAHKRQAAAGLYASAMAAYVAWLAPQLDQVRGELRELVLQTAVKLAGRAEAGGRDHRTAHLLAEVAVGMRYFLRFAVDAGAITPDVAEQYRQVTWVALQAIQSQQALVRSTQDPAQRFCELVSSALASGRCYLTRSDGSAPEEPTAWGWRQARSVAAQPEVPEELDPMVMDFGGDLPPRAPAPPSKAQYSPSGPCIGVIDSGPHVFLRVEAAHEVARAVAVAVGDPLPLTLEDLPKRLYERGLLARTELETRRTFTVRKAVGRRMLGGYLCIPATALGVTPDDDPTVSLSADVSAAVSPES
jgi:hypothetical protein